MITKERLTTEYIFYRSPNIYFIFIFPLFPSLIAAFFQNNLYTIEAGVLATTKEISSEIVQDYLWNFKFILGVVTAFFLVYRWSLIQRDGSYGYWITQGVDGLKLLIYATTLYAIFVSFAEILGFLIIYFFMGVVIPIIQVVAIIFGIFFSNFLWTAFGILVAEISTRPDIAGLVYLGGVGSNLLLNSNSEPISYQLLLLEFNYFDANFYFFALLELILIAATLTITYVVLRYRDIEI